MPLVQRTSTHTQYVRAVSSSEAASLKGKPAKTPIIAGTVCGALVVIAWLIGFTIYFRKRYHRKKRKRAAIAAGVPPPEVKSRPQQEKVVIPPDPAVYLGQREPGYAFTEEGATVEKSNKEKGKAAAEGSGNGRKSSQSHESHGMEGAGDSDGGVGGRPSL